MEQLKHECGVAMIRLLKPLEYYEEKYGTWMYGLNKLYLLMEKQHNRGTPGPLPPGGEWRPCVHGSDGCGRSLGDIPAG